MSTISSEGVRADGPANAEGASERQFSRRELFRGAGRGGGLGAMIGGLSAALLAARDSLAAPPVVAQDLDPRALIVKLVRRASFGPTPDDLALAQRLGYDGWLDFQLKPGGDGLRARLAKFPLLGKTANQIYSIKRKNFDNAEQARNQLARAAIHRAVFSKKQLVERLVEFFGDHFNIVAEDDKRILKLVDDRTVIRKHVLGAFPDMLRASAQSPAMMRYLNNDESTADNPNENYAREVMELHTLSPGGGYTQDDVANIAKCLTGWGLYYEWDDHSGRKRGTFRFDPDNHNTSDKIVLGQVIPGQGGPAGIQEGLTVLAILAARPACARFLATKLCRKFLSDQPDPAWIDAVAATYTQSGGHIPSMIRTLLQPAFVGAATPKLKRPFHLVASAVRALGVKVASADEDLQYTLELAGQEPFQWHPPNGYPEAPGYWANNPLPRWNFAAALPFGEFKDLAFDLARFFRGADTTDLMMQRINDRLFQGLLTSAEDQAIRGYLAVAPQESGRQAEALGLALSSPSFQWC